MKTSNFNHQNPRCKYIMLKQIGIFALFAIVLTACKTTQPVVVSQVHDSIRIEYRLDSIYLYERDSIYIDRYRSNDTVYLTTEKWLTRYKDKVVIQHDTIATRDSIAYPVEVPVITNEVPKFYKGSTIALWVLIALFLIYIVYRIVKAVYLRK